MSIPNLISPLLDGFTMGNAMSSHDGVRCYPAIKENSDDKYIVKIISIPASQVQLDALLLTGAYKDPADAMDYFKDVSDGVVKEAEHLQRLSKLDGFLAYEGWQVVPMEDGKLGYKVCLFSPYKRSLEKYMRRSLMTHLEAVNLGLDLCAALAVCRRAGLLYVDLKPGNIFISRDKTYRIGDLGFVELDSLQYTSLPGKYRSPYSPPEARNDLNTLNDTVDIYALGMILYQIYNDGALPEQPKDPTEAFPAPANADYEISAIIMKALSPDPKDRWQDPIAMGQALVAYMQSNTVNSTPIKPPALDIPEDAVPVLQEETPAQPEFAGITQDDSAPDEQDAQDVEVSEALSELVDQADDLISHEMPEGVVVPEPAELPIPDFGEEEELEEESEEDILKEFLAHMENTQDDEEEEEEDEPLPSAPAEVRPRKERKPRKPIGTAWVAPVIVVIILALLGGAGFWFYQNYYLQTIDSLTVDGSQTQMVVSIESQVDPSLLTVVCTDTYGNSMTQSVVDGKAVFTDLLSNSQYKIQLQISGFHKLVGKTTDVFNTDALTNIVSLSAVTGPEDGSVMLTFTVDGPEPEEWTVTCLADGQEKIEQTFTGHNVTVKGLTVGSLYTFYLTAGEDTALLGQTSMAYIASQLVTAKTLAITSCDGGELNVDWEAPEDATVESWTVRCYGGGYDQTQEVTETEALFTGIDPAAAYTVEVTAAGMTTPIRTNITANPITIREFAVDDSEEGKLTVTWNHDGEDPVGGWLLMYTIDDSDPPSVVKCDDASAEISPRLPSADYRFTIQAADGTSIFSNEHTYKCPSAEIFQGQALSADKITGYLLKTPEGEWSYESEGKEAFSDTFTSGDSLSLVLQASVNFYLEKEDISVMYVFRDGSGNVLPDLVSQETVDWEELWYDGDYHMGELNIPKAPTEPGDYSLSLYFNNKAVIYITFSITE